MPKSVDQFVDWLFHNFNDLSRNKVRDELNEMFKPSKSPITGPVKRGHKVVKVRAFRSKHGTLVAEHTRVLRKRRKARAADKAKKALGSTKASK